MKKIIVSMILAAGMAGTAVAAPIGSETPNMSRADDGLLRFAGDGICGWYYILGCSRTQGGAWATLNRLGGPGVGGWVGANVVHTNDYPNFRNGWWCVADGPYRSRGEAGSIAWKEAVPDAYVKSGC